MKHLLAIILLAFSINFQSCKTLTIVPESPKSTIERFVSTEAISNLRVGMSLDEVESKLGSKPFNILSVQADGHYIVQYKYRISQIEVNPEEINSVGVEKKNNKTVYLPGTRDAYLVFDKLNRLEYLNADQSALTEHLLRDNNMLYVIKKDKDKYTTSSDSNYRDVNRDAFSPLVVCPSCDHPVVSAVSKVVQTVEVPVPTKIESPLPKPPVVKKKKHILGVIAFIAFLTGAALGAQKLLY